MKITIHRNTIKAFLASLINIPLGLWAYSIDSWIWMLSLLSLISCLTMSYRMLYIDYQLTKMKEEKEGWAEIYARQRESISN